MIRIQLPACEASRVQELFRSTQDRKLRDRLQIVLMAHRGRPRQEIAHDLGIHRMGVTRWLNAYGERGLDGLRPRKAKGGAGRIPASMADEIRCWVIEGPAGQGLDRANGTHEERADHLCKTHGLKTSRSAMHRYCQKIGVRPYRPTYRYLRGDADKQTQARQDLTELTKGPKRANSSS